MATLHQEYYTPSSKVQTGVVVQTGDLIIVSIHTNGGLQTASCADSASGGTNTYSQVGSGVGQAAGGSNEQHVFYAKAKASETLTVTVTTSAGSPYIWVQVVSGVSASLATVLDTYANYAETVTTITDHASANATPSTDNSYLFCQWGQNDQACTTTDVATGFSNAGNQLYGITPYYKNVTSSGTYYSSCRSTSASAFISILAVFKADSATILDVAQANAVQTGTVQVAVVAGTTLACPTPSGVVLTSQVPSLGIKLVCPTPTNIALSNLLHSIKTTLAVPLTSLSLAASVPTLKTNLVPPVSSITLTGLTPSLNVKLAAPTPTNLSLVGSIPTIGTVLPCPSPIGLSIQTLIPNIGVSLGTPVPTNMSLTALVPSLGIKLAVVSSTPLTLTNQSVQLRTTLVCPAPANLSLGPLSPTLGITGSNTLVCPAPTNLSLTSNIPKLAISLVPGVANLGLNPQNATLAIRLSAGLANISFSTPVHSLRKTLAVPVGPVLQTTTKVPSLSVSLAVPTGSLNLASNVPSIVQDIRLTVPLAEINLTSLQATIRVVSELQIPDLRYSVKFRNNFTGLIDSISTETVLDNRYNCRIPGIITSGRVDYTAFEEDV